MGCNTREENAVEAMAEDLGAHRRELNAATTLQWAKEWQAGNAHCPSCPSDDMKTVDSNSDGSWRVDTWACCQCGTRWKVQMDETAVSIVGKEDEEDGEWIEFSELTAS